MPLENIETGGLEGTEERMEHTTVAVDEREQPVHEETRARDVKTDPGQQPEIRLY